MIISTLLPGCDSGSGTPDASQPSITPSAIQRERGGTSTPTVSEQVPLPYQPIPGDFETNGDYIQGWYWLRDSAVKDYAQWVVPDLSISGGSLSLEITALATNTFSGGPGYDASFLLYYGIFDSAQAAGSASTDSLEMIPVTLENVSPPSDPVGYTCQDTITLHGLSFTPGSVLVIRVMRESATDNHVAFNQDSISYYPLSAEGNGQEGGDTGDGGAEEEEVLDTDGDGIYDDMEPIYGTLVNDSDTDNDGIIDGEDLSPLIDPVEPPWQEIQEKGMVRIQQPIKAYGLDGWAEKWHKELTWSGFKWYFDASYESTGTKKSTMTVSEYKKALNKVFEADHFIAYKIEDITPADIAVQDEEWTHDKDQEKSVIFAASWPEAPNEYRFYYDYLTDYRMAYLKNDVAMRYPNETEFYRYLLYPLSVKTGYEQSVSIQFKDMGMYQALNYIDDNHYKIPGFLFAFYGSNNLDTDSNVPDYQGLALARIEKEGQFQVNITLPKAEATDSSSFLKLTPVWIEKSGFHQSYTPMLPNWNITGLTRDVTYLKDSQGNSKVVSEEFETFDSLNITPRAMSFFTTQQPATGMQSTSDWMGIIKKDPGDEEAQLTVMDITQTIVTYIDLTAGTTKKAATYTESFVKAVNKVDDLDDLPANHWARSPKYATATSSLSSATGIISMATNGHQAWVAFKEGNAVDVVYYSARTALGAADTAPALVQIAQKSFGYAGKATKLGKLATKKAAVGLAIAAGVVEVTYNIYQLATTDDTILQTAYVENIAAETINTGISVAAVFSPHVLVFQLTWTVEAEIYSWIFGEDFAYQVAQSPGSALVFLVEYFATSVIPSQMAEEAYLRVREDIIRQIENLNVVQLPYLAIFIDPDL